MPDENEMFDLAELFKVFGDSTRIRILFALFDSEKQSAKAAEAIRSLGADAHLCKLI